MEEWPQRPVGIAVIIFVDVLFFEVDRRSRDAPFAVEVHMPGELLGLLARPAEPDAPIFLQRRRQRDPEAALRPGGALGLGDRQSVVEGKTVSVRVVYRVGRSLKNTKL